MNQMNRAKLEVVLEQHMSPIVLTRQQKLDRWAKLIEESGYTFGTFSEAENEDHSDLMHKAVDGSIIALAYADPLFRSAGLRGHTYGDAMEFFDVTRHQLHRAVCGCNGQTRIASHAAYLIKTIDDYVIMGGTLDWLFDGFSRTWRAISERYAVPDRA